MQTILQRILDYKLSAVIVLAVIVRLMALIVFAPTLNFNLEDNVIHGSESYDAYAQNLLSDGVYGLQVGVPDAILPPVYSYTLAFVYATLGRGFLQVGLYHIALDALAIALLYMIARRLFPQPLLWGRPRGEWLGALAGLFFACYPYLVFQNMTVMDTSLWIVQLHAYVLLMIVLRDRPSFNRGTWGIVIMAGILLGIATLTRPITPFLAIFTGLWLLTRLNVWQMVTRLLPVALIGFGLLVPWMARNYAVYDDFVSMTTTSGGNLWQGNNPWTVPVFRAGYDVQWTPAPPKILAMPQLVADRAFLDAGIAYWRELAQTNPSALVELFAVKFAVHWSIPIAPYLNPQAGEQWRLEDGELVVFTADGDKIGLSDANIAYDSGLMATLGRPVHVVYFGGLFLLALGGILIGLRRDWRSISLILAVQFSMTLTYMLFHPSTRYRSPTDPLLFLLSAYTLVWMAHRWQAWRLGVTAPEVG